MLPETGTNREAGREGPPGLAASVSPGRRRVMAVLPGCPSRHEPARSQGFQIPANNFPNELARMCDSVESRWRGAV